MTHILPKQDTSIGVTSGCLVRIGNTCRLMRGGGSVLHVHAQKLNVGEAWEVQMTKEHKRLMPLVVARPKANWTMVFRACS